MAKDKPYNPFEPLTAGLLDELIRDGIRALVLQRFRWPGLAENTGFMGTCYRQLQQAAPHADALLPGEGKCLNLAAQEEQERVKKLLANERFTVFVNTFREEDWKEKMLEAYAGRITANIRAYRYIQVDRDKGLDVNFEFYNGRLVAELRSGERTASVPAFDLLK